MHSKKNYFDNLFNTVIDITDKTKDKPKARVDLIEYYKHRKLHLQEGPNGNFLMPKTIYTFNLD